jgi:hypothetical protein
MTPLTAALVAEAQHFAPQLDAAEQRQRGGGEARIAAGLVPRRKLQREPQIPSIAIKTR